MRASLTRRAQVTSRIGTVSHLAACHRNPYGAVRYIVIDRRVRISNSDSTISTQGSGAGDHEACSPVGAPVPRRYVAVPDRGGLRSRFRWTSPSSSGEATSARTSCSRLGVSVVVPVADAVYVHGEVKAPGATNRPATWRCSRRSLRRGSPTRGGSRSCAARGARKSGHGRPGEDDALVGGDNPDVRLKLNDIVFVHQRLFLGLRRAPTGLRLFSFRRVARQAAVFLAAALAAVVSSAWAQALPAGSWGCRRHPGPRSGSATTILSPAPGPAAATDGAGTPAGAQVPPAPSQSHVPRNPSFITPLPQLPVVPGAAFEHVSLSAGVGYC